MPSFDSSVIGLYQQASPMVQGVLLLLLLCSVLGWSLILHKLHLVIRLRGEVARFEQDAAQGRLPSVQGGLNHLLALAGREEAAQSFDGEGAADRRTRLEEAMRDALVDGLGRAERRLPYLATIGSSAPFIGLFGTVWGIMHSFSGIAQANDTSLAVVAPGIAEALLTTAIGLATAIPASIAYNKLATDFAVLFRRYSLAISRLARRADQGAL